MMPSAELSPPVRVGNGPPTAPPRRGNAPLRFWFAVAALFLAMPLLAFRGIRENSVTVDEFAHMPAGYAYWRTGDFSIYARNPPLIKLIETIPWLISAPPWRDEWLSRAHAPAVGAWGPWALGDAFMRDCGSGYAGFFEQARWMTLGLALVGGAVVFFWSLRLFGRGGALLSLAAYAFCPTILAHGSVATTDIGAMVAFSAACFAIAAYAKRPTILRMVLAGAALGLALAAKLTAILLLIALPVLMLILLGRAAANAAEDASFLQLARPYGVPLLVMPVVAIVVINATYGFHGTSFNAFAGSFSSSAVRALSRVAGAAPLPLPRDYVRGFDEQQYDIETDDIPFYYLDGKTARNGWWYYFPLAFAYKEPVALVALVVLGLALAFTRGDASFVDRACLLTPLLLTVLYMMFFNRLNIGVRYLLPVYPLLFVLIGGVGAAAARAVKMWRALVVGVAALAAAQALAVLTQGPDYLSFFNEALGGRAAGRRHLADSNLDWGQDLLRLANDERANGKREGPAPFLAYFGHVDPALVGIRYELPPTTPTPGTWIVSANYLLGMPYPMTFAKLGDRRPEQCVEWLRDRPPTYQIGGSLFVFEVPKTP